MEYTKVWLSYDQQASLLIEERGLIADREYLIRHLKEIGYYRLSGYWYIFKRCNIPGANNPDDENFVEGTTCEEIWRYGVYAPILGHGKHHGFWNNAATV